MSYHSTERRGRSSRRSADRYDDRYNDRYHYGHDTYYDDGYGYGRGDYTAVERYHSSRPVSSRRSKSSHRTSSSTHSGSSSHRSSSANRELKHVVTSALAAGAVEAFRLRKTPGPWASGAKGGRVATAAIGAAVADSAVERNNHNGKHSRRHVVEATVAGLLADRLLNGSRKK
ncbi:hypothetical protein Sste5346_000726 [Sporothrix stenoceras]|uniref:Uncharacterized protein n=1 Tax=Sporothrix stenoceras TaxID=5173 RepID=A0ABR3ZQ37_9PEZI